LIPPHSIRFSGSIIGKSQHCPFTRLIAQSRDSNVDRIIAMYQHRYPDTFVEPANQPGPTYTTATDSVQDINSNLYPFHMNTNGDFWTSQGVRNWETFGYTYPELQNKPSNETLTLAINNLYRPVTPGLQNATSTKHRRADNATSDATDWMAEVNMPSDIQMTYSVRAFLGPPPEDPEHWATDPNYVGQVASLASPKMDSDVIVTANIMLTERLKKLFDAGALPSLERADVEGFLHENFFWRIQKIVCLPFAPVSSLVLPCVLKFTFLTSPSSPLFIFTHIHMYPSLAEANPLSSQDNTVIPRNSPPEGLNATVLSVPIHLPSSDMEVPTWTGGYDYKPSIEGHPPPPQPNGTEPEVVVLTSTIVQVVTVTPERIRKY
jgi:tyrosinase